MISQVSTNKDKVMNNFQTASLSVSQSGQKGLTGNPNFQMPIKVKTLTPIKNEEEEHRKNEMNYSGEGRRETSPNNA